MAQATSAETILIVDDEESVRRTIQDWLKDEPGVNVLAVGDVESALRQAEQHEIDLAILDWNLGAGLNGLDLLQDLYEFNPSIIAVMITAFADQATPLDAMRHGVRDYLDKNQELNRDNFLKAVRRQLNYIRPAKRERRIHQGLVQFRSAIDQIMPLMESLGVLTDPVTLPNAVTNLFHFLKDLTHASDGALVVRQYDSNRQPSVLIRVFHVNGEEIDTAEVDFSRSIAASAISHQQPCAMTAIKESEAVSLMSFEKGRTSLLAIPLEVTSTTHIVLELFDKLSGNGKPDSAGFSPDDIRLAGDAGLIGAELMRQHFSQRQMHKVLLEAVETAMKTTEQVTGSPTESIPEEKDHRDSKILDQIREGLHETSDLQLDSENAVKLAEAIRQLATRHGSPALKHCTKLITQLAELLDDVTGTWLTT